MICKGSTTSKRTKAGSSTKLWTEFAFGDSQTTVRAGVLDLNAEFDAPETLGLFVGPPHRHRHRVLADRQRRPVDLAGHRPRRSRLGRLGNGLVWRLGVYDGAPGGPHGDEFSHIHVSSDEGSLTIGELAYSSERVNKISLGAWSYSAKFERVDAALVPDAEPQTGNRGFYALIDVPVGSAGDTQFDAALRLGTASDEFNPVENYVGAAFTAAGFWSSRPDDAMGLAIAYAHLGDPYREAQAFDGADTTSSEISYEFAYSTNLTPWLALKPGVQFVQNPGADPSVDNAWIIGLRFEIVGDHSWQVSARHGQKSDDSYARSKP